MSDLAIKCLEVGRNRRTCAGMDEAIKRIRKLETQLDAVRVFTATDNWSADDYMDGWNDALKTVHDLLGEQE